MPDTKANGIGKFFLWILVLLFAVITFVQVFFYVEYRPTGDGSKEEEFVIEDGQNWDTVLQNLKDDGLIRSVHAAKLLLKLDHDPALYAGSYELNSSMNTQEILKYIGNPDNQLLKAVTFTIIPGEWAKDIAADLSKSFPFTAEDILAKWNDTSYIQELAADYPFLNPETLANGDLKVKLEGYLFPNTYHLDQDMDIDGITRMFLDGFSTVYTANKEAFDASEMSVEEIVTLASIVQFEAGSDADMPDIAEVFLNRLAQGMRLESSVTVCYALYEDYTDSTACETSYNIESPYNTYLNAGLPAGPIDNPSAAAIEAVLHPADNDYLFFAADVNNVKDGGVYYSATWEEHNAICAELGLLY